MNNNSPVTSKDLSAEELGTAFFWDMAQRDVPEEGDPHDYPVLCNNTNPPWKAGKLLISGGFEAPLREQPPWNQDQNRTPPVQSNSRTTQDSKTETNRIHLKKTPKQGKLATGTQHCRFGFRSSGKGDDSPKRRESPNNTVSHPRRQ